LSSLGTNEFFGILQKAEGQRGVDFGRRDARGWLTTVCEHIVKIKNLMGEFARYFCKGKGGQ
jgi:hypothetical protein